MLVSSNSENNSDYCSNNGDLVTKVTTLSLGSEGRPQYMCSIASVCRPNHILLAPRFNEIFSAVKAALDLSSRNKSWHI